jgi:hypothetical protein
MIKQFLLLIPCFLLAACTPKATPTPAPIQPRLSVEEHALGHPPEAESAQLDFVKGTQEAILAVHTGERSPLITIMDHSCTVEGHFGQCAALGTDQLAAWADDTPNPLDPINVNLTRNGSRIYQIPVGNNSPIGSLRGLWVYDNHWVLETAYVTNQQTGNAIDSQAKGQITIDGVLLNDQPGYQETFGFQMMRGRPFYFFKQGGKINASYDGTEIPLGYDELPHYYCCSAATLDPKVAQNMVAIFARKGSTWDYVEIGVFGQTAP